MLQNNRSIRTVIFCLILKILFVFLNFYYVSLNNFFLTIAYAINTAIPVITHETGYTFISISKLLNLLNTVYIHINLNTHDPNTVSTAGVIEYPNPSMPHHLFHTSLPNIQTTIREPFSLTHIQEHLYQ